MRSVPMFWTPVLTSKKGGCPATIYTSPPTSQFHADKLSSAHVYLRMNEGDAWDAIPPALLVDCAQLTKANSIEGRKVPF